VPETLTFWEYLRTFARAYPPHPDDIAYQQHFAPLGLLAAESPYVDAGPALSAALQAGEAEARASIEEQSQHAFPLRNNWQAVRRAGRAPGPGSGATPPWRASPAAARPPRTQGGAGRRVQGGGIAQGGGIVLSSGCCCRGSGS
jgi:hypothetical protein